MLVVFSTKQFKKDLKKLRRSGVFDDSILELVIDKLSAEQPLQEKYQDHALKGSMQGWRECHLRPNLLLVYKVYNEQLILELVRLGSHSELFD
mgnify:CR=1 FL=1